MRTDYHSAHYPIQEAEGQRRAVFPNGVAQIHDVTTGNLPSEFGNCDLIYADPSWRRGYDIFNARAGIDGDYKEYCRAMIKIISLGVPTVYVWGAHVREQLPGSRQDVPVMLNENRAVAYLFNGATLTGPVETAEDVLADLAQQYDHIGDPCCGYGNTARAATRYNKRFCVSDVNPACIGYIANHYPTWEGAHV